MKNTLSKTKIVYTIFQIHNMKFLWVVLFVSFLLYNTCKLYVKSFIFAH